MQGPAGEQGPQGERGPQGLQGLQGPPGTTDWNGLTNVPSGFSDNIDNDTLYSAGAGLELTGTVLTIAPLGVTTAMLADDSVTSAKIADLTRSIFIPAGSFSGVGAGVGNGVLNFGASRPNQLAGLILPNNSDNVASATFVIPPDFKGSQISSIDLLWGTDEGVGGRATTFTLALDSVGAVAGAGSPISTRATTTLGNGPQGSLLVSSLPFTALLVAPGEVVAVNVARLGNQGSDTNAGNVYLVGVRISYLSDR
ncbi:MAG: hypothetical protein SFZ23_13400 [Planctomycetota bacterium]|nr:hypothetical protein [Planctomycetota bacterium]